MFARPAPASSAARPWCRSRRRRATSSRRKPGSKPGRPSRSPDPEMASLAGHDVMGAPPRSSGRGSVALMLAPVGGFYLLFFGVPMLSLFVLSFWRAQGFDLIPTFTLESYAKIATSPLYQVILLRTIGVGLLTAAITV